MSFATDILKCEVARTGHYGEDYYKNYEKDIYENQVFCEKCGNDIYDPAKNIGKTYVYEYGGQCLCEACFTEELFDDLAPECRTALNEWEG
jgi:hypothetical protein